MSADWNSLLQSDHIRSQAERLMPVLAMVCGTAEAPTLDQVVSDIAIGIAALRKHPEAPMATSGRIRVLREPLGSSASFGATENYHIAIVSATVYSFQMLMEEKSRERSG